MKAIIVCIVTLTGGFVLGYWTYITAEKVFGGSERVISRSFHGPVRVWIDPESGCEYFRPSMKARMGPDGAQICHPIDFDTTNGRN
jgi:hypothetical protein